MTSTRALLSEAASRGCANLVGLTWAERVVAVWPVHPQYCDWTLLVHHDAHVLTAVSALVSP